MQLQKIGRVWYSGKTKIDSYELYNIFGRYINVKPSQITATHVAQYLEAKAKQIAPFEPKKIVKF